MNRNNQISSFFRDLPSMLFSFCVLCVFIITQYESYEVPSTQKKVSPPAILPSPDIDDPATMEDTLALNPSTIFI